MGLISLIVGGAVDAHKAIKQNQAKNDDTVQNVVIKNKYSIDVPSFLSPTTNLGEKASLQYGSRALDCSMQVIDEPNSEFAQTVVELKVQMPDFGKDKSLLENRVTLTLSNLFDLNRTTVEGYANTKINGMNAIVLNGFQKRTFLKDAMYGTLAFVEGKETLYQIIILSGGTSIKTLSDKLEKAIYSFKEL